ncbi:MAG: hypothetical protein CL840_11540 [Crocinitomicaceae bacterium]|nr:hypothetical protein [Crocinitomicaceae bacterium]|tara:strand:- start:123 stop:776 length:654 start_codon:yes stop_codon:yes gene_type:complete
MRLLVITYLLFNSVISFCSNSGIPKDSILPAIENEEPDSVKLFVFVGEKIFFKQRNRLLPEWRFFHRKYVAKFKILKPVYGFSEEKTVKFIVYSHLPLYDFPEYALLFMNKKKHGLELEYRMWSEVKKTTDGRFAECRTNYNEIKNEGKIIEPVPLDLEEPEYIDISMIEDKEQIANRFPKPYYEIVGDSAKCLMGFYPRELFLLEKNSVLKARGIF